MVNAESQCYQHIAVACNRLNTISRLHAPPFTHTTMYIHHRPHALGPQVLERLHPVPVAYLKTLAGHGDLFLKLPYSVQRQVWEMDRKLLQQHMLPLINGCAYESCMLASLLDMDDTLPLTRTFKRAGAWWLVGWV